jgi:hypothetical protein
VKEASGSFAGKFKVVRVEIGSVTRGLREILLDELQSALNTWGVSFIFPSADQVNNNKNSHYSSSCCISGKISRDGNSIGCR